MGTITAYVLVRHEFAGRGLLNGVVDMPFAITTLITGVMLFVSLRIRLLDGDLRLR